MFERAVPSSQIGRERVLACGCWEFAAAGGGGPSPDVKAGNSWHKETWPLGGAAGFLAVGSVLPADGVGLGVSGGTMGIRLHVATLEGVEFSGKGPREDEWGGILLLPPSMGARGWQRRSSS